MDWRAAKRLRDQRRDQAIGGGPMPPIPPQLQPPFMDNAPCPPPMAPFVQKARPWRPEQVPPPGMRGGDASRLMTPPERWAWQQEMDTRQVWIDPSAWIAMHRGNAEERAAALLARITRPSTAPTAFSIQEIRDIIDGAGGPRDAVIADLLAEGVPEAVIAAAVRPPMRLQGPTAPPDAGEIQRQIDLYGPTDSVLEGLERAGASPEDIATAIHASERLTPSSPRFQGPKRPRWMDRPWGGLRQKTPLGPPTEGPRVLPPPPGYRSEPNRPLPMGDYGPQPVPPSRVGPNSRSGAVEVPMGPKGGMGTGGATGPVGPTGTGLYPWGGHYFPWDQLPPRAQEWYRLRGGGKPPAVRYQGAKGPGGMSGAGGPSGIPEAAPLPPGPEIHGGGTGLYPWGGLYFPWSMLPKAGQDFYRVRADKVYRQQEAARAEKRAAATEVGKALDEDIRRRGGLPPKGVVPPSKRIYPQK